MWTQLGMNSKKMFFTFCEFPWALPSGIYLSNKIFTRPGVGEDVLHAALQLMNLFSQSVILGENIFNNRSFPSR